MQSWSLSLEHHVAKTDVLCVWVLWLWKASLTSALKKKPRNPFINGIFNKMCEYINVVLDKLVALIEQAIINVLNSFEKPVCHSFSYNRVGGALIRIKGSAR